MLKLLTSSAFTVPFVCNSSSLRSGSVYSLMVDEISIVTPAWSDCEPSFEERLANASKCLSRIIQGENLLFEQWKDVNQPTYHV